MMAHSTAVSRFASSNTSSGDLPPSSSVTRLMLCAAVAMTREPVGTEPVKDTWARTGVVECKG